MTDAARKSKSAKGNLALRINAFRQVHVYVSLVVAPLLIFWTITGALQVFRIPDKHPTSLLAKLASVHKNATFAGKAVPAAGGRGGRSGADQGGGARGASPTGPDQAPPAIGGPAQPVSPSAPKSDGQASAGRGGAGQAKPPQSPATLIFKWYEATASIALTISTLLGVWMGIAYHRRRGLMWLLLAIGTAAPIILLIAA